MSRRSSEPVVRVGGLSKRAPRACESCRARKVRCDVTRTKAPCTNCRLDSKTCVLPASRRRHVGDRILGSSFLQSKLQNPQSPICDAIIDFGDSNKPVLQRTEGEIASVAVGDGCFDVFDLSTCSATTADAGANTGRSESLELDDALAWTPTFTSDLFTPYPSPTQTLFDFPRQQSPLPSYISPVSESIASEDLQYLRTKGAFDIPEPKQRDQLLRAYALYVHPFTPMLDLEDTLTTIFGDGQKGTVSLLLFQSMLFAATAYIDIDHGKMTRKERRRVFYKRARLLHDFGIEGDPLSICQAAILLSFWDGQAEGVRDSYYWIGVATLHATNIGLESSRVGKVADSRLQQVYKKTWWSLLVRDRLLAVTVRRPVQNKAFRFDVPMFYLVDFNHLSFVETVRTLLHVEDVDLEGMETLVSLWMAVTQLSEYIDKVLSMQYTTQRTSGTQSQSAAVVSLVPRKDVLSSSEIMACGQELQNWYGYLPSEAQQFDIGRLNMNQSPEHETVRVHRALLAGYYSMTLMTLYRPVLNLHPTGPAESELRNVSMKMVLQATKSITDIFADLYADDLISLMPDTAIAVLEPAVTTHLLRSMSDSSTVRETSFQRFYLCWRILLQFKETYHLAETTMSMLDAAAKRLKSVPDLRALKATGFSRLMEEHSSVDGDVTARPYMAVPFVGVVGDQKTDGQSDTTDDWTQLEALSGMTKRKSNEGERPSAVGTEVPVDPGTFEQLVHWDEAGEEFQL